jgi:hypothetical protein
MRNIAKYVSNRKMARINKNYESSISIQRLQFLHVIQAPIFLVEIQDCVLPWIRFVTKGMTARTGQMNPGINVVSMNAALEMEVVLKSVSILRLDIIVNVNQVLNLWAIQLVMVLITNYYLLIVLKMKLLILYLLLFFINRY